jgi:hypothetical protein
MDTKIVDLGKASQETQGASGLSGDNLSGSDPLTTHTPI